MTFEAGLRATEVLMALAYLQQSLEHLRGPRAEKLLFATRIIASLLLLAGFATGWALAALILLGILILIRFQGPYNGGSDRMSLLILFSLAAAHALPTRDAQELALGYLAVQVILSYVISGKVKLTNPDWRSGQALVDVFAFSAYPVSEALRGFADKRRLLRVMSWAVILFEVLFPFALLHPSSLIAALVIGALFHLANACLFGLNRFFWIWLAAYPSLIWFQDRIL